MDRAPAPSSAPVVSAPVGSAVGAPLKAALVATGTLATTVATSTHASTAASAATLRQACPSLLLLRAPLQAPPQASPLLQSTWSWPSLPLSCGHRCGPLRLMLPWDSLPTGQLWVPPLTHHCLSTIGPQTPLVALAVMAVVVVVVAAATTAPGALRRAAMPLHWPPIRTWAAVPDYPSSTCPWVELCTDHLSTTRTWVELRTSRCSMPSSLHLSTTLRCCRLDLGSCLPCLSLMLNCLSAHSCDVLWWPCEDIHVLSEEVG
jgi:hypothetical protein